MTQLELQAFLSVVHSGSFFPQAAQTLFITQPALSRRIRAPGGGAGATRLLSASGRRRPLGGSPPRRAGPFLPSWRSTCGWAPLERGPHHPPAGRKTRYFVWPRWAASPPTFWPRCCASFSSPDRAASPSHQYHSQESLPLCGAGGDLILAFISDDMYSRRVEDHPRLSGAYAAAHPSRLLPPRPRFTPPSWTVPKSFGCRGIRNMTLWHSFLVRLQLYPAAVA